jgi:hypothetical protein
MTFLQLEAVVLLVTGGAQCGCPERSTGIKKLYVLFFVTFSRFIFMPCLLSFLD